MRDRARDRSGSWNSADSDDLISKTVYTAQYRFDEVSVMARVSHLLALCPYLLHPLNLGSHLSRVGGLDTAVATEIVGRFESYFNENEVMGGGSKPDASTFGGYVSAYSGGELGAGSDIAYVEALLGIQGMTREAYDRIRRSVAPIRGSAAPDPALAPAELKAVFQGGPETLTGNQNANTQYFCVELLMDFDGAQQISQRIWVAGQGAMQGQAKLVRVERPVLINRADLG